ncbi:MAG: hypothetical protein KBA31_00130 [Alphaproteobacteria bacterium]|nr:hypothetical protein [Alphaproteobacteria bacterium]
MAIQISIKTNAKELRKSLSDFAKKQVPFAVSQALTAVAREVAKAEVRAIDKTFPTATPFSLGGVGVAGATKSNLMARIFMREIAAAYFLPYLQGGRHALFGGRRSIQVPVGLTTDRYGNLGKGRLSKVIGRPDVFVGKITFRKSGETVAGVWQRPKVGKRRGGGHGTKGSTRNRIGGVFTGLKLLARFEQPQEVKQRLPWAATAQRVVEQVWAREFDKALAKAIATARR